MEYSFRNTDGKLRSSMDEVQFREFAEAEGIPLSNDDSTNGYMRAFVVSKKFDEKIAAKRRKEWFKFALKVLVVVVPVGGLGGIGIAKAVPDAPIAVTADDMKASAKKTTEDNEELSKEDRKQIRTNSVQIEKLGGVVVDLQEMQVATPDYIIDSLRAKPGEVVEKPEPIKRGERAVQASKKKVATGKLLALTPEEQAEVDAAINLETQK